MVIDLSMADEGKYNGDVGFSVDGFSADGVISVRNCCK